MKRSLVLVSILILSVACERSDLEMQCPAEAAVGEAMVVVATAPAQDDCRGTWTFTVGDDEQAQTNVAEVITGGDGEPIVSIDDGARPPVTVSLEGGRCVASAELVPGGPGRTLIRATLDDSLGQAYATCTLDIEDTGVDGVTGGGQDCELVTFRYTNPDAREVFVSGSFNGWPTTPAAALELRDDDGDGMWSSSERLERGAHEYKLVVDGEWIADPANAEQVPDGLGAFNSLVRVCQESPTGGETSPGFLVEVDAGAAHIEVPLSPAASSVSELAVTLDWAPIPADALSLIEDGGKLLIETDVDEGIHDVRVERDGHITLVKVHVGVSHDWRDAPIYFAMTDRFANGDAGNDAPVADVPWETNFQGGDFAGIKQKLESGYFNDLGVGALWISWPATQAPGFEEGGRPAEHRCGMQPGGYATTPVRYTAYHGYWPTSLNEVDPRFGTMAELQDMVRAAHARGVRVMLDLTANHVHIASQLWNDRMDDGYFNTPGQTCTDVGWDNAPRTCWFDGFLPDLNYENPEVRELFVDTAVWWVKQTGADGFRFDAVKHLEMSFVQDLRAGLEAELEHGGNTFYVVGETFTGLTDEIMDYVGGDRLHGQFDFPSNIAILEGFGTRGLPLSEMDARVRGAKGLYGHETLMSTFFGNHDIARFLSLAAGDLWCGPWDVSANKAQGWMQPPGQNPDRRGYDLLQLAFTYVMTTPGVPLIYYGDEFGIPGGGDPDNRRFMRFEGELSQNESDTLSFVRSLMRVRSETPALRRGVWTDPLWNDGEVLAYGRVDGDSKAVILLNRSDGPRQGALDVGSLGLVDGPLRERLWDFEVNVSGGSVAFDIPPRSAWILVE
jgi:glycosidase